MDFHERKAHRAKYYEKYEKGWKSRPCSACSGSGRYDSDGSPPCGACSGTGKERYKPEEEKVSGEKMFAKIFDRPIYGQILVKLDNEEGKPELRWYAKPPELGVCSFAMTFTDDDKGRDSAELAFENADEAAADKVGSVLFFGIRKISTPKT